MYSVCNTLEGGVAAVGHTNSFTVGLLDMFFLKADSSGVFNRLNCGPQGNIFEQIVNFSNNAYAVTPRVWPINPSQPNNSTLIVNPITIDFCLPIDAGFIADTVICEGDCIDIVDTSFNATTRYWAFQGATPATSNQVNPSNICYLKGGTFTIRQIVANTYATDTAYLNIRVIPKPKISLGKDTILCKGDTLHIKPNTSILYNFKWQDGSSSKTYSAVDSGKYWLTVSEGACQNADTMVLDFITLLPPFDLADTLICKGEILLLDAKNSSAKHFWFNGDTSKIITVTEPGINFVTSRIGGCSVSDTINVDITELISTGLVADTALCIGETITLNTSGFQNLIWQDGSQNTSYTLADTGTYWVEVLQKCGVRDSIHVRYYQSCACYMQFPSGFTPNNDQLNDGFLPKIECDLKHYTLQIYNRWGEKLFETNDPTAPWLGTNAAKRNCENGLYYFRCIYSGIERDIEKPNVIEGIIGLTR